jgi:hypothetical protein
MSALTILKSSLDSKKAWRQEMINSGKQTENSLLNLYKAIAECEDDIYEIEFSIKKLEKIQEKKDSQ